MRMRWFSSWCRRSRLLICLWTTTVCPATRTLLPFKRVHGLPTHTLHIVGCVVYALLCSVVASNAGKRQLCAWFLVRTNREHWCFGGGATTKTYCRHIRITHTVFVLCAVSLAQVYATERICPRKRQCAYACALYPRSLCLFRLDTYLRITLLAGLFSRAYTDTWMQRTPAGTVRARCRSAHAQTRRCGPFVMLYTFENVHCAYVHVRALKYACGLCIDRTRYARRARIKCVSVRKTRRTRSMKKKHILLAYVV